MSHRSRWEYFRAIYARYHQADGKLKQVILNEFCANTGYHRKYAIRLLNGPPPGRARPGRVRRAHAWIPSSWRGPLTASSSTFTTWRIAA
ncbi:MAG TPA: hypothetical protein VGV68_09400 [Terriglobia bacterium]|nr:hypothetical protein [Terriglobia bacterium]